MNKESGNPDLPPSPLRRKLLKGGGSAAAAALMANFLGGCVGFVEKTKIQIDVVPQTRNLQATTREQLEMIVYQFGERLLREAQLNTPMIVRSKSMADAILKQYFPKLWQNRACAKIKLDESFNLPEDRDQILVTANHGFDELIANGVEFFKVLLPEIDGEGICGYDLETQEKVGMVNAKDIIRDVPLNRKRDIAIIPWHCIQGRDEIAKIRETRKEVAIRKLRDEIRQLIKNPPIGEGITFEMVTNRIKELDDQRQFLETLEYNPDLQGGLALAKNPLELGEFAHFFIANLENNRHTLRMYPIQAIGKVRGDEDKELVYGVMRPGESGGGVVVFRFYRENGRIIVKAEVVGLVEARMPKDLLGGATADSTTLESFFREKREEILNATWRDPNKAVSMD